VNEGCYQESTWEIPSGKTLSVTGEGKDNTVITVGSQNNDGFIICNLGLFILLLVILFV
jgi:hypothetical protein